MGLLVLRLTSLVTLDAFVVRCVEVGIAAVTARVLVSLGGRTSTLSSSVIRARVG